MALLRKEHDFPGRHAAVGRIETGPGTVITESPEPPQVPDQLGEIQPFPIPQVGVFGPRNRHNPDDTDHTRGESAEDPARLPKGTSEGQFDNTGAVEIDWDDGSHNTSSVTSPLHYRELQRLKIDQLKATHSFDTRIPLHNEAKEELQWWSEMLNSWNGHPILPLTPDLVFETDASLL